MQFPSCCISLFLTGASTALCVSVCKRGLVVILCVTSGALTGCRHKQQERENTPSQLCPCMRVWAEPCHLSVLLADSWSFLPLQHIFFFNCYSEKKLLLVFWMCLSVSLRKKYENLYECICILSADWKYKQKWKVLQKFGIVGVVPGGLIVAPSSGSTSAMAVV